MLEGLKKLFGDDTTSKLKPLYEIVERINGFEAGLRGLSGDALKDKTEKLKRRLDTPHNPPSKEGVGMTGGETVDDILPEAFALVRESARRTLGERHFDVQLLGGMVLHRGGIS